MAGVVVAASLEPSTGAGVVGDDGNVVVGTPVEATSGTGVGVDDGNVEVGAPVEVNSGTGVVIDDGNVVVGAPVEATVEDTIGTGVVGEEGPARELARYATISWDFPASTPTCA